MVSFPIIYNTYKFECTMCGNCCSGPQEVNLDLLDLWKLGKFLGLKSTNILFEKSLVKLVLNENKVWIPQIRFKQKPLRICPFLMNEKSDDGEMKGVCQLHPNHKPLICAISPVGRIVDLDLEQEEFVLVPPASDCAGMESSKFNYIQNTKDHYSEEFINQMRFFRLLNHLKNYTHTEQIFYKLLYVFDLQSPFPEILNLIESKVFAKK